MPLAEILTYWRPGVEVAILWAAYFILLSYVKDSGAIQVIKGLLFLALLFFISQALELKTIGWVLASLFPISILGFVIVFQPEIRRGLTRLGQNPLFKIFLKEEKAVDEVARAVFWMSKNKVGALVVIERQVGLKSFMETGVALDSALSFELLVTIFMPGTFLHDGAVIIQGGRVAAAGCLLPLSESPRVLKSWGTRHRAGLGLSEETDALVIVVSEETGAVTLMNQGKVAGGIDEEKLLHELRELYRPQTGRHRKKQG